MTGPHFIASDIHLGAVPPATERAFLRFLEHAGHEAGALLLPGDLFDFWFEYGDVIPGKHFRVLAALAALVEAGIPVAMVGGNHDAWGGRFLREEVGIDYTAGELRTELAGRPALVVHGDGVGRGDLKYRALKAVIRSRAATTAFRAIHPELGLRLAGAVSRTETRAHSHPAAEGRARYIAEWARRALAAEPALAWVVCGHAHVATVAEVEPGRFYLNAGDWIGRPGYIAISPEGEPELRRWEG